MGAKADMKFSTSEKMYVNLYNRKMNYMLLKKIWFVTSHHHLGIYNTFQALALTFKRPFFFFSFLYYYFEKLSSYREEGVLKLSRIVQTLSLRETMYFEKVHEPIILPDESHCGGRLCRPDHFVSSFLMVVFFIIFSPHSNSRDHHNILPSDIQKVSTSAFNRICL